MIIQKRKLGALVLAAAATVNFSSPQRASAAATVKQQENISVVEERIGDRAYQVSKVLIKARPDQVWQVLTDYNNAPNVFATLKRCRIVVDKGNNKIIHYQIKPTGLMTSFEYDLDVHEQPNKLVEWHRVAGDFKAVDGFWKLEPVDCGRSTLVTYATYVNGGIWLPQAFIKHQSHIDFPGIMAALKTHTETTLHLASHASRSSD